MGKIRFSEFALVRKVTLIVSIVCFISTVVWNVLSYLSLGVPKGMFNFVPIVTLGIGILLMIYTLVSELAKYYKK